jgi:hypothetical protein
MKLIVSELKTELLYQAVIPSKSIQIAVIRPHIYIHNAPSGYLFLQILDVNNQVIVESNHVSIVTINPFGFYHGYIQFDINLYVKKNTQYRILLSSSGYTFNESAYVGWCNDYDLAKYSMDYVPVSNIYNPLDLEIWYKNS